MLKTVQLSFKEFNTTVETARAKQLSKLNTVNSIHRILCCYEKGVHLAVTKVNCAKSTKNEVINTMVIRPIDEFTYCMHKISIRNRH